MAESHDLGDPAAFMAGVALFDALLREAERRSRSDDLAEQNGANLRAAYRGGGPLTLYALPFVEQLLQRPDMARGFAGALGDYVGMLQEGLAPAAGDQYARLTFDDCTGESLAERSRIVAQLVGLSGEARRG